MSLFQFPEYFRHARKKRNRAKFAEARRALPVAVFTRGDDGHKRHTCITRSQRVVNVVAKIQRRRWIALPENLLQSLRVRLSLRIVHGDDCSEVLGRLPVPERKRKFLPRAPREEIQRVFSSPLFNLPRRYHQLFVTNVSRLAVASLI